MIWHLTAHAINCVCHSIMSIFRVLGIYNFGSSPSSLEWKKVDKISIENRLLCPLLSSKIILFSSLLHEIFNCFDLSLISYLFMMSYFWLQYIMYVVCLFWHIVLVSLSLCFDYQLPLPNQVFFFKTQLIACFCY